MRKRNTLLITLLLSSLLLSGCSMSSPLGSSNNSSSSSSKYAKYIQQYNQASKYLDKIQNSNSRLSELQVLNNLKSMGISSKAAKNAFNDCQNSDDGGMDFTQHAVNDAQYYYNKIRPKYSKVKIDPYNITKYRQKIVNQLDANLTKDGYDDQQIHDALRGVVPFYFTGEDNTSL